jgi:hypothetical protein
LCPAPTTTASAVSVLVVSALARVMGAVFPVWSGGTARTRRP